MKVVVVAACTYLGVMGKEGGLPWPPGTYDDLKYFKELTEYGCIIMGRKTWESLPKKPLPNRVNFVLSRKEDAWFPGGVPVKSLDSALLASAMAGFDTAYLIGGEQVFKEAFDSDKVDEIILTEIFEEWPGDVGFYYSPFEIEFYGWVKETIFNTWG